MKTLKNNKLLAWMLALITAFCAFLGVMLPSESNVALADSPDESIYETLPDTSNWEEIIINRSTNLDGKIIRVYLDNWDFYEGSGGGYEVQIFINETGHSTKLTSTGYVLREGSLSLGLYKIDQDSEFIEFYVPAGNDVALFFLDSKAEIISLADIRDSKEIALVCEVIDPEVSITPEVGVDGPSDGNYSDDIANTINEYTGWAITGSMVTSGLLIVCAYLLLTRRRRR